MTYQRKTKSALWTELRPTVKQSLTDRKRVRPVSKAQAKRLREYEKKRRRMLWHLPCTCETKTYARAFICGTGEFHNAEEIHHMRGRRGSLLNDERFWLPICRAAHQWIHNHPAEAKALGLIEGPWNTTPK